MSETPPPPRHPPPDESPIQSPRTVTFQLNNSTSFFDEFAITQETFRQEIEGFKSGDVSTPTFSTTCQFRFDSPGISLTPAEREKEHFDLIGDDRESRMIIEEVVSSAAAAKIASTSNNSLDSLSECGQAHSTQPPIINHNNNNNDRSQSLGDLLIASQQQQLEESNRNGSFDTLMSKGLSDSGIGAFPRDDNLSPSTNTGIMDYISSPDSISSMSFGYFDPSSFSNENANPLDGCNSRTSHYDERKPQPELAAISEESEHETTSNYHYPAPTTTSNYHSASVDKDRDIIEHSYPMTHCSSAPTNTAFSSPTSSSADKQQSYFNNNIAHRRVVSDEVTDTTTLKRSKEMENVDKIGSYEYEVKANQNLKKKGRCKSLMFIVQGSGDELTSEDENQIEEGENEEEEDDIDGGGRIGNVADTRDNDLLIYNRNIESSPRRNLYEKNPSMPCSNEPPPVRLSRKVSASSTRSTPIKTATDQSWKDKMPPFSMSGHNMYSPQSLPSRDAIPRSPFDGSGTFTSRLPYTPLPNLIIDDIDTCSDGKLIMSELSDDLPPLSSIYRPRTPSLSSTATDCMNRSPEPNNNLNEGSPSSQTSFVRRGLRKIMKRSSASAGALIDMDGPRGVGIINQPGSTNSLKRRASAASSSLIASASAHLKPRAKSLKKQRLGKPNKKEKSGSDTFTFNFFRRKQQAARPNLTDIISDLDQRSTSTRNLTATTPTDLRAAGNLAASNRRSTSASILPMSDGGTGFDANSFDGLPDHISRMVSPNEDPAFVDIPSSSSVQSQLDRLWGKYDLFAKEEYQSWHEKYRHNTLSQKQVKKQDAIYELYLMEKRHCANIAFLLQGYRRRMLEDNIVSKHDMDILIPDVLDSLLIFHLNVLEKITERISQNHEVSTISDIIHEHLNIEGGPHTELCCKAYTDFGLAKEKSDVLYYHLMSKTNKFSEFFKRIYVEEPIYKQYDFRPLITKIIGRATKYSLLLETILKNETPFSHEFDMTTKALETARKFAHKIDENLSIAHMSRKWDEIKAMIEPSTTTGLFVADPVMQQELIRHHFDLESLNSNPDRKLVHIGEAYIKVANAPTGGGYSTSSSNSGKSEKNPGYLVLFDDIIVLLQKKGTRFHFMQDQGAIPVKTLLTRTSARGQSIMLISGGKPILFEISFNTSADRKKWVSYLEAAPKNVPIEGVRLSQSNEEEMLRKRAIRQEEMENQWLDRLNAIYQTRFSEEDKLSRYLESRLEFFDLVRAHMSNMPFKSRHDISDRIREAVRGNFKELKRSRTIPLNRLVDMMSDSRDSDLYSFFDEKADSADFADKSTDLSDSGDSSSGGESSSTGRTKPRRIQTFHGTSQPGAPSSSSAIDKNGIRRHTTVPRMNSDANSKSGERGQIDEEQEIEGSRARGDSLNDRKQYEEMMAKLPLRQSLKARRASTRLIKEVILLRKDNHLLRNENALTKSRCALLEKCRGTGSLTNSTASAIDESMEKLRKKEKELRELRKELSAQKEELDEKQKSIESQEIEIQTKWNALQLRSSEPPTPQHVRSGSAHSTISSPTSYSRSTLLPTTPTNNCTNQNIEWSPVLTSLATKIESKKVGAKKT